MLKKSRHQTYLTKSKKIKGSFNSYNLFHKTLKHMALEKILLLFSRLSLTLTLVRLKFKIMFCNAFGLTVLILPPPPQKVQQNKESLYLTAVHQGLSQYLTAKDTHISPTSIKHSKTLLSHSYLL